MRYFLDSAICSADGDNLHVPYHEGVFKYEGFWVLPETRARSVCHPVCLSTVCMRVSPEYVMEGSFDSALTVVLNILWFRLLSRLARIGHSPACVQVTCFAASYLNKPTRRIINQTYLILRLI